MVRRIVKCSACLKRFATASGKDQCPTCRLECNQSTMKAASANNLEEVSVDVCQSQQMPLKIRDDHKDGDLAPADLFKGRKRRNQPTAANVEVGDVCKESFNNESDTGNNDDELKEIGTNNTPTEDVVSKKPKIGGEFIVTSSTTNSTVACSIDEGELYDDDLRCITNGSNADLNDDDDTNNQPGDGSCCGSENDDLLIECIEIDEDSEGDDSFSHQKELSDDKEESPEGQAISQPQVNQTTNKPENDVCYICGANLAGKGFKSRVAHMKRCSTKFGPTMKTSSAEVEDEMMMPVESASKTVLSNPYKNAQWHGDSGKIVQQSKEKQSMLNQFFKAPMRSLTSVLMNGSRQAKKKADEISSLQQKVLKKSGKKASFRKGSWASNKRRSGQCPSYKRIPGTDFLCDGFYYSGSLTQNYFLTHFHSDHYGGIDRNWKEGIIYCSVSRIHRFLS